MTDARYCTICTGVFCICFRPTAKTGAHGWPLVPSIKFPGELTLACPQCGSVDITLSVIYGPGGRLGDPGSVNTITCGKCGKRDYSAWGESDPRTGMSK